MEGADPILYCPHCGDTAPQALKFRHEYHQTNTHRLGASDKDTIVECLYEVRICATCHDLVLYHESDISPVRIAYPVAHALDRSVPPHIRQVYEEAARARRASPSTYALLLRRAIEAICDDRGIAHGSLQQRLAKLADKGEIPPVLAEPTAMLRTTANAGAHARKEKITVPLTRGMDELFRALVEYVYVGPSSLAEFGASLKRRENRKPES